MIRQIEEVDTKGGIIIQKNKFKEFVEFQKVYVKRIENIRILNEGEKC